MVRLLGGRQANVARGVVLFLWLWGVGCRRCCSVCTPASRVWSHKEEAKAPTAVVFTAVATFKESWASKCKGGGKLMRLNAANGWQAQEPQAWCEWELARLN